MKKTLVILLMLLLPACAAELKPTLEAASDVAIEQAKKELSPQIVAKTRVKAKTALEGKKPGTVDEALVREVKNGLAAMDWNVANGLAVGLIARDVDKAIEQINAGAKTSAGSNLVKEVDDLIDRHLRPE